MIFSAEGYKSCLPMIGTFTMKTSALLLATLCTACGDDTTIIQTTFLWTGNVTMDNNTNAMDEGDDTNTPTEVETFGDGTTTTDELTDTGDSPTTGGEQTFPPSGCAFFVEVRGRLAVDRHVTIDTSACEQLRFNMEVVLDVFGNNDQTDPATTILPKLPQTCITYGNENSAAGTDPDGIIIPIDGENDPIAYRMQLWIDGEVSDEVFVPGPTVNTPVIPGFWPEKPFAPKATMRRQADFSWALLATQHQPGCDL